MDKRYARSSYSIDECSVLSRAYDAIVTREFTLTAGGRDGRKVPLSVVQGGLKETSSRTTTPPNTAHPT